MPQHLFELASYLQLRHKRIFLNAKGDDFYTSLNTLNHHLEINKDFQLKDGLLTLSQKALKQIFLDIKEHQSERFYQGVMRVWCLIEKEWMTEDKTHRFVIRHQDEDESIWIWGVTLALGFDCPLINTKMEDAIGLDETDPIGLMDTDRKVERFIIPGTLKQHLSTIVEEKKSANYDIILQNLRHVPRYKRSISHHDLEALFSLILRGTVYKGMYTPELNWRADGESGLHFSIPKSYSLPLCLDILKDVIETLSVVIGTEVANQLLENSRFRNSLRNYEIMLMPSENVRERICDNINAKLLLAYQGGQAVC